MHDSMLQYTSSWSKETFSLHRHLLYINTIWIAYIRGVGTCPNGHYSLSSRGNGLQSCTHAPPKCLKLAYGVKSPRHQK